MAETVAATDVILERARRDRLEEEAAIERLRQSSAHAARPQSRRGRPRPKQSPTVTLDLNELAAALVAVFGSDARALAAGLMRATRVQAADDEGEP
jgi:hypothetical protein